MTRFEWLAIALAAGGAALVLFTTAPHGPALYQLGMHNAVAAERLLRDEPLLTTRDDPFAQRPPLSMLLLALGRAPGVAYEQTARLLDAASFAALIALAML